MCLGNGGANRRVPVCSGLVPDMRLYWPPWPKTSRRWGMMDATSDGFTVQIANDLSQIAPVTARLQALGSAHGLPQPLVDQFVLALDELVANIVQHGLPADRHETIRISIMLDAVRLRMEISDPSHAFDPLHEAPAPDLDSP